MTFDDLMSKFKPGLVARRLTWDTNFTLEMKEDGQVRLYDQRNPSFNPVWQKRGYDADAEDYYFKLSYDDEWLRRKLVGDAEEDIKVNAWINAQWPVSPQP